MEDVHQMGVHLIYVQLLTKTVNKCIIKLTKIVNLLEWGDSR